MTDPHDTTPAASSPSESLPEGWVETTLGDASSVIRGITFPASAKEQDHTPDNVACLRTSSVQKSVRWDDVYFVSKNFVKRDEQLVRSGDILMSMANSYELVGKVARVKDTPYPAAFGAFLSAVRPSEGTAEGFLFNFLRTDAVQAALREGSSQTTNIANISIGRLAEIPLPLPPLPEQIRIADKLDALLSRVEAGQERLERVPGLLKRFRQSVLSAAVSGELTREWRGGGDAEWETLPLNMIVKDIEQGWSPQCEKQAALPGEWAVIKTTAIQHMRFLPGENKRLPDNLKPRRDLVINSGDILITRAGPRIRAGVACVVRKSTEKLILCDKAYRFRAKMGQATPEFIEILLNEPQNLAEIDSLKTGISESGVNLTQGRFLQMEVVLPNLLEQTEIVRRVEALFAIADRIEARYRLALTTFNRLTPALLAKAFRGELVPQDPDDEPASVLLERIRAARAGAQKKATEKKVGGGRKPEVAQASAGVQGEVVRRGRGRPPKAATAPTRAIPLATSEEDAIQLLQDRARENREGRKTVQPGLFDPEPVS